MCLHFQNTESIFPNRGRTENFYFYSNLSSGLHNRIVIIRIIVTIRIIVIVIILIVIIIAIRIVIAIIIIAIMVIVSVVAIMINVLLIVIVIIRSCGTERNGNFASSGDEASSELSGESGDHSYNLPIL